METRHCFICSMILSFADCTIDTDRRILTRGGSAAHVEPQVFELLLLLVERAGSVVTRDEIVDRVWSGRIVSEATISARISAARAAVGDSGKQQAVIRTVTRVGLELVTPVRRDGPQPSSRPDAAPLDIRFAVSEDGSGIAWASEGEGPPLLRAGHWLTNLELDRESPIWGPWLAELRKGRRLVRYDFRGTGMSDLDCGPFSLEAAVSDMEAVADAAGLERFPIFAASQSAAVSFAFAARHPDRVSRIVSYGGWPQGAKIRSGASDASVSDALATMIRLGWGQPDGGFMRSFSTMFMPSASKAQIDAFVALQRNSTTGERAVEIRDVISYYDVTDILPQVRCPVLVLHARHDNLHPFSQAQLLTRLLPDAHLTMLDSANHILMPDEPAFARLMQSVDAFLDPA